MDLQERYTKEVMCCDDLTSEIRMHIRKGNFELVDARMKDLQISVDQLKKMDQQKKERIKFRRIVRDLNRKGILAKVVKRLEKMAR